MLPNGRQTPSSTLAPVAHLDRVMDFESIGSRFESCRAHNVFRYQLTPLNCNLKSPVWVSVIYGNGREITLGLCDNEIRLIGINFTFIIRVVYTVIWYVFYIVHPSISGAQGSRFFNVIYDLYCP